MHLIIRDAGPGTFSNVSLVDVLRNMSFCNCHSVIGRSWYVCETAASMDGGTYEEEGTITRLFGDLALARGVAWAVVTGEVLLTRSALVYQVENCYCGRLIDEQELPHLLPKDMHLDGRFDQYQSSRVDMEIICDDFGPMHVLTADRNLSDFLCAVFADAEMVDTNLPNGPA